MWNVVIKGVVFVIGWWVDSGLWERIGVCNGERSGPRGTVLAAREITCVVQGVLGW